VAPRASSGPRQLGTSFARFLNKRIKVEPIVGMCRHLRFVFDGSDKVAGESHCVCADVFVVM
jgi:hypothetical protein